MITKPDDGAPLYDRERLDRLAALVAREVGGAGEIVALLAELASSL
jgi:hypothetical protein